MKKRYIYGYTSFVNRLSKFALLILVLIASISCMFLAFGNKATISADNVLTAINIEQSFVGGGGSSSGGSSGSSSSGSITGTSTFSGGSGTSSDPYKISKRADFEALAKGSTDSTSIQSTAFGYYGKYFIMTNDIDLSGFTGVPYFSGASFDGAGYKIKNMSASFGLFKHVNARYSSITIQNIVLQTGSITINSVTGDERTVDVGALISTVTAYTTKYDSTEGAYVNTDSNYEVKVQNCYNVGVSITINGFLSSADASATVGGLIGCAESLVITNCANYKDITVNAKNTSILDIAIGGIVGYGNYISIQDSANNGNITCGTSNTEVLLYCYAGGIMGACGSKSGSSIIECANYGKILASANKGSTSDDGLVYEVYAGGILGYSVGRPTISYCYNMANIEARADQKYVSTYYYINADSKNYKFVLQDNRTFKTAEYPNIYYYYTYAYAGGIIACEWADLSYCYSLGKVTAPTQITKWGFYFYIYGFLFESNRFRYDFTFTTYRNNAFGVAPSSSAHTRTSLYYAEAIQDDVITYTDHNSATYTITSGYTKTHDLGCTSRSYYVRITSQSTYGAYFYIIDNSSNVNSVLTKRGGYFNTLLDSYNISGKSYMTFVKVTKAGSGSRSSSIKNAFKSDPWRANNYSSDIINSGYSVIDKMYW